MHLTAQEVLIVMMEFTLVQCKDYIFVNFYFSLNDNQKTTEGHLCFSIVPDKSAHFRLSYIMQALHTAYLCHGVNFIYLDYK